jgi:NADPH2:quinone reductase
VAGKYNVNPTPPFVPGFEVAGEIAAVGSGVTGWTVGARVVSMPGWGGYAQYVCAKASTLVAIPDGVDFVKAAACPVAYTTSHLALKEKVSVGLELRMLIGRGGWLVPSVCVGVVRQTVQLRERGHAEVRRES